MKNTHLLIIDPQHDFCDSTGSLFVAGADADMKDRLPKMLSRLGRKITEIHCTLDSHHPIHIAHPIFWVDAANQMPAPFTVISSDDIKKGKWRTKKPSLTNRALTYVEALEKSGRYMLMIWPPHCQIGTNGHKVVPELSDELVKWDNEGFKATDYVTKGSNFFTEHYSAIRAEVPDPGDPSTQLNTDLIGKLMDPNVDEIAVAGEASSHCVANTVTDIAKEFGDPNICKKIVLLADVMSAVTGCDKLATDFFDRMKKIGVQFSDSVHYLK